MLKVSTSEIRQNSMLLQNALREDIIVTKHDKPFVVVIDYEKYKLLMPFLDKVPNEETVTALQEAIERKNLTKSESLNAMFEELGI